VRIKSLMEGG